MQAPTYREIAKMLDHGLLKPGTTDPEFEAGIDEAIQLDVASVCIQPHYLARLVRRLEGTGIFSSTVIGFPHGSSTSETKLFEARQALDLGCQELDVVANIGKLKSGHDSAVRDELAPIVEATHSAGQKIKIILETALLDDPEKIRLCQICSDLKADWAKTSTGFAAKGATPEDVELMRRTCPSTVGIKASGGVRTLTEVLALRDAGADRIGTSSSRTLLAPLVE